MEEKICPNTWLAPAILVTLFCCLPFGIVGIVYAAKVSSLFAQGSYDAALQASKSAKMWSLIGMGCGLFIGFAYFIFFIFSYMFAATH